MIAQEKERRSVPNRNVALSKTIICNDVSTSVRNTYGSIWEVEMAPFWQVDIEKLMLGEYWSNRYIVDALSLGAAVVIAHDIVEIEQTIHSSSVLFTKVRTSDRIVGTDIYQVDAINEPGANSPAVDYLPLFNVVRVDFSTIGGGRPSRKYLRLPILESQQTAGTLETSMVAYIKANYADLMADLEGFVDVDGQAFSSGSVYPFVGMRQLRRGSKRKLAPIIP